jgi:cytochrome oxidase assembly protein ShyY1
MARTSFPTTTEGDAGSSRLAPVAPPPAASPPPATERGGPSTGTVASGRDGAPADAPGSATRPSRQRLWLRWGLLGLFALVLGAVFVTMGQWQLDRLHQRQERNASALANAQAPVRPYSAVFTHPITEADEWQRVEARGVFDAEHQFVLRYRTNGDDKGYQVVTPLLTPTGAVLVDRGFVRLGQGEQIPVTAPAPPAGEVSVVGHVRRDERGRRSALTPVQGQMRLINSVSIGAQLPYPVANGYLSALTLVPPQSPDFQPIALLDLSDGPHFWYALQWFMFTLVAAAGVIVFIRGDVREGGARRESPPTPGSRSVQAAAVRPGTDSQRGTGDVSRSRHGSGAD